MAQWSWKTLADGRIAVDKGEGFVVDETAPHPAFMQAADEVQAQWLGLAEQASEHHGVPATWILAIILAESGGDAGATNFCCTGLMGIMTQPPVHGKSKAQMLDPAQNVDHGASLLAKSVASGLDFPGAASVHVGGADVKDGKLVPHSSSKSPWGMVEHMWPDEPQGDDSVGYIDRVVRAHNMFVRRLGQAVATPPVEPPGPGPVEMARASLSAVGLAAGAAIGLGAVLGLRRWLS